MDKIAKFLKRLTKKGLVIVEATLTTLLSGDVETLDIKKLKGFHDIFRVRSGDIRIIFRKVEADIKILEISRRNEKTYRDF